MTQHLDHPVTKAVTWTVPVPFQGGGAETADLSWGQAEIWSAMVAQESSLPLGGVAPLPGKDVDDVVAALRWTIGRHRALRTRLRFEPDGRIRQKVSADGEFTLHVMDVPDDGDPADVAADAEAGFRATIFDYEHEWPLRMAAIRHHGVVTHLVGVFCHLTLDLEGMTALFRGGLGTLLLTDTDATTLPATDDGPDALAQVAWQRSPAGQRHNKAVQRYWTRQLARVDTGRFTDTDDERSPRHWQATLRSPAAYRAMRAISARTTADSSAVLLAAAAVATARSTGRDPAVFQIVVSNRFRPGMADSVSPIAQSCLCVIDVADAPFDDVIARAARSARNAYLNSYFDRDGMEELIAELGTERGAPIDLTCFYNDRRAPENRMLTEPTTPAAESTIIWGPHSDSPFEPLFVHINDVPGDVVEVLLQADTRCFPPTHMQAFLDDFESTLLAAAEGDAQAV